MHTENNNTGKIIIFGAFWTKQIWTDKKWKENESVQKIGCWSLFLLRHLSIDFAYSFFMKAYFSKSIRVF